MKEYESYPATVSSHRWSRHGFSIGQKGIRRLSGALVWICSQGTPSPVSGQAEEERVELEGDADRRRVLSPSCRSRPLKK